MSPQERKAAKRLIGRAINRHGNSQAVGLALARAECVCNVFGQHERCLGVVAAVAGANRFQRLGDEPPSSILCELAFTELTTRSLPVSVKNLDSPGHAVWKALVALEMLLPVYFNVVEANPCLLNGDAELEVMTLVAWCLISSGPLPRGEEELMLKRMDHLPTVVLSREILIDVPEANHWTGAHGFRAMFYGLPQFIVDIAQALNDPDALLAERSQQLVAQIIRSEDVASVMCV